MLDSLVWYDLLFGAVFLSQIFLVSIYYPWSLRRVSERLELTWSPQEKSCVPLKGYMLTNSTISLIGFCLLGGILYFGVATSMTLTLLSIGAYFFLQLSPLASSPIRRLGAALRSTTVKRAGPAQLSAFVGRLPLALAVLLVAGYLSFAVSLWSGGWNTHLLKMMIFAGTQLLFAVSIGWNLLALNREKGEIAAMRYEALLRLIPLLIFASVMISFYYFGKELIAIFDLDPIRPVMMSAFLQLFALLAASALFPMRRIQNVAIDRSV